MITTKCADYDVALVYLEGTNWDLDGAVQSYKSDEKWEAEHPMTQGKGKKQKKKDKNRGILGGGGTSLTRQRH